jgi:hypothetical protein
MDANKISLDFIPDKGWKASGIILMSQWLRHQNLNLYIGLLNNLTH